MTIIPNTAGIRLLTAWRDLEGWSLADAVPVLALAISEKLEVEYLTPAEAKPLEDTVYGLLSHEPLREVEWANAIVMPSGEIVCHDDKVYPSSVAWLESLTRRDQKKQSLLISQGAH